MVTRRRILVSILLSLVILVSVVSAASDYCTPPENLTTVVDNNGGWWNITITSDYCYTCVDTGYGNISCTQCDNDPPASITNLNATLTTCWAITWDWDNPTDPDFNHTMIYRNGTFMYNITDTHLYWNDLEEDTEYQIGVRTCDVTGNCNATIVTENSTTTVCDVTPPQSISNLTNTSVTCNYIGWTWDNPPDEDYYEALIYRYDEGDPLGDYFYGFVFSPDHTSNWSGLDEDTDYTISVITYDGSVINYTWVNRTEHTPFCPVAPVADFTANETSVCTYDPIQFTDTSSNTPTSWWWLFGDSQDSHIQDPTHYYDTPGLYDVNLTVSNGAGEDYELKIDYINVTDCSLPVAEFTASDTEVCIGENVTFTDLSTGSPTTWYWLFGDGNSSFLQNPSYNWSVAGLFNISLKAANVYGNNVTEKLDYINVTDCNAAPTVSFTSSVTCGIVPFWVLFNDTSTGIGITDYYWEFGDGNTSVDQNPLYQYNFTGVFSVNHSATNYIGTSWYNVSDLITSKNVWESCAEPTTGVQYDTNTYKPGWFTSWFL